MRGGREEGDAGGREEGDAGGREEESKNLMRMKRSL